MEIITLTICGFLFAKELGNLAYNRKKVVTELNVVIYESKEDGIDISKIIWVSLGFYVGILV